MIVKSKTALYHQKIGANVIRNRNKPLMRRLTHSASIRIYQIYFQQKSITAISGSMFLSKDTRLDQNEECQLCNKENKNHNQLEHNRKTQLMYSRCSSDCGPMQVTVKLPSEACLIISLNDRRNRLEKLGRVFFRRLVALKTFTRGCLSFFPERQSVLNLFRWLRFLQCNFNIIKVENTP